MELLVDARPAYLVSGEEAVVALDGLHAEIARPGDPAPLEFTARLDDTGYTKETTGQDTARFVAVRYRRKPAHRPAATLAPGQGSPEVTRIVAAALARPVCAGRGRPDHPVRRSC